MSWPWVTAFVILWFLVLTMVFILIGLIKRLVPILSRAEHLLEHSDVPLEAGGLDVGEQVPPFGLSENGDETLRVGDTLSLPAVFLFIDNGCEPCRRLRSALIEEAGGLAGSRLYIVSSNGSPKDNAYDLLRARGLRVFGQRDDEASRAFRQNAVPQAFAVDGERRVVESLITDSVNDLRSLLQAASAGTVKNASKHADSP